MTTTNHPPAIEGSTPSPQAPGGLNFTSSQDSGDDQSASAAGEPNHPNGHGRSGNQASPAVGDQISESQCTPDTQANTALGSTSMDSQARHDDQTMTAVHGSNFTSSHGHVDSQRQHAAGEPHFPNGQISHGTQSRFAVGDQTSTDSQLRNDAQMIVAVRGPSLPNDQAVRDDHLKPVVGDQTSTDSHFASDTQAAGAVRGPFLADPVLGILADVVDDLEGVRIANENRLRTLTDGSEHGHGLTLHNPEVANLAGLVDSLKHSEHQAVLSLKRIMRRHPLGVWAKPIAGVGEKQLARLLAVIGDPYWNDLHDRPRTVSELWAFCGYHVINTSGGHPMDVHQSSPAAGSGSHTDHAAIDNHVEHVGVAPKRQRGQKSNWNEDARKRCFLIAESCMKEPGRAWPMPPGSPPAQRKYRRVYEETRDHYADAVHTSECVRCGPKGKPAKIGSPLSPGHQNARALRKVAKTLLKDLWREAKRVHELDA